MSSDEEIVIDEEENEQKLEIEKTEEKEHEINKILDENEIVLEPKVGMMFNSKEEVRAYYMQYAKQAGFGVSKRTYKLRHDGNLKYFTISSPKKNIGCKAKINATCCPDGKFTLTTIVLDHVHTLSPGKARYFRCHKQMDSYVKRRLELNDKAGIRIKKDYKNHVDKARQLRLGVGSARAIRDYFVRMQEKDDQNVFWADARSRATCEYFGNVITFDTTYLTNPYKMSFALFVGVNHHRQSILLGCGLISNENYMSGRALKAIITNQDQAMKRAIEIVFPETKHRFCLWHIMKKIPKKFKGYSQYEAIKRDIDRYVYVSLSRDKFEDNNEWLQWLYYERHHWIPTYVKNTFWVVMSTTLCSESMNAFFDGYVGPKTTLKQFADQYDEALKSKVEKENTKDFFSLTSRQFQESYTNSKFKEVQDEIRRKMYCHPFLLKQEGAISTYQVVDEIEIDDDTKEVTFHVYFNEDELEDSKQRYAFIKCIYNELSGNPEARRYDKLRTSFYEVTSMASKTEESCMTVMIVLDKLKEKLSLNVSSSKSGQTSHHTPGAVTISNEVINGTSKEFIKVLSPLVARSKG
ncbi:hypothetical protein RGQ29_015069 [Quercus rubra]|uniref:Protein FAR1-RELATED SEQUENCE n=1 Tax=Quercus rubra TaxID=3512 RepID=A0AAN7FNE7_QUERU|nr:hypothetical protein RGQ29_015069 [Quercus rubra]